MTTCQTSSHQIQSYQTICYEKEGQTGILRLNRPERMNAVIEEMYMEIQHVLDQAAIDSQVRALILTGSSFEKNGVTKQAFCAGADLKKHGQDQRTHLQKREYIKLAHQTTKNIYEFPKPLIAVVNGPARGAGVEMALNCDVIFMAENATFAFPEVGLGTFVGGGATFHLERAVGITTARDLIYTGKIIDGRQAHAMGLALKVFALEQLMVQAKNYATILSQQAPVSMAHAKKRLNHAAGLDLETILALETDAILECMDTKDWHEGIQAFKEKRKPDFKGR